MGKEILKVDNVGMKFNLMENKVDNFKEYIIKLIKNELRYQEFWALRNISFTVNKGDRLGILGLNGAGKSTLLKIIAGVLKATEGSVTVKGKIVPLLELGAGFDPQYTGVENIYLYGAVLGYPKDFIREKFDEIVEFSELGEFIHVPVKNYSSGMKARLGFSIATVVEPEILILDEVLSVGDAKFRKKSEKRILEMFDKGITVLFVSHSIEQIKNICNRAIILDRGSLVADGPVDEICNVYEANFIDSEAVAMKPKKENKAKKKKKKKQPVNVEASQELGIIPDKELSKDKLPDEGLNPVSENGADSISENNTDNISEYNSFSENSLVPEGDSGEISENASDNLSSDISEKIQANISDTDFNQSEEYIKQKD